ncbi:MAG: DMT family transporter [Pseudomonadota bacterium]
MSPAPRSQAAVLAAALLAVGLWGATPLVTKLAVGELTPLTVALLRTVLAATLALPVILLARLAPPRGLRPTLLLGISALCGFVLFPLIFTFGQARTSAGHGALILAILPVLTGSIAALLERRLPVGRWWIGVVLAALGTWLLIGQRHDLAGGGATLAGDLLVLASALAASLGYVTGALAQRALGTWRVTFWGLAFGGLLLLPLLPFASWPAAASPIAWGSVLYLAGLSSILAYAAWYWALGQGEIARTGVIQFAQPVIGVVLAVIILQESLSPEMLIAAAAILLGVAVARSARS